MVRMPRLAKGIGLAVAGAVLFVGTASAVYATTAPPDARPDLLTSSAELQNEYERSIEAIPLALPEGITYPKADVVQLGAYTVAEPGVGAAYANFYWKCAWAAEYFGASENGDASTAKLALDVLGKWDTFPFAKVHIIDPDRIWYKEIYSPALAGDSRLLFDEFSNGCQFYERFSS